MTPIGYLLAHAASETSAGAPGVGSLFQFFSERDQERHLQWLIAAGLGPMLLHVARAQAFDLPPGWTAMLQAADLERRLRHANLVESAHEVIDICREQGITVTLLKGISLSEHIYSPEYLRPMGDVDILFPRELHARVTSILCAKPSGYEPLNDFDAPGMHHDVPLRHCTRQTVVELHTRLYPTWSRLSAGQLFGLAHVAQRSMPSSYHGRPVLRLCPELQLSYVAASWFNDMTHYGLDPSFIPSMFDAVLLLKKHGERLDWEGMREWLDNELARASLYAMLTYLPRFGALAPPSSFIQWLASSQTLVGSLQRRLIHWALDRHLVGAQRWTLFLPPPMPGRYSLRHQLNKRLLKPPRRQALGGV